MGIEPGNVEMKSRPAPAQANARYKHKAIVDMQSKR